MRAPRAIANGASPGLMRTTPVSFSLIHDVRADYDDADSRFLVQEDSRRQGIKPTPSPLFELRMASV
jgi:hypothetical protein